MQAALSCLSRRCGLLLLTGGTRMRNPAPSCQLDLDAHSYSRVRRLLMHDWTIDKALRALGGQRRSWYRRRQCRAARRVTTTTEVSAASQPHKPNHRRTSWSRQSGTRRSDSRTSRRSRARQGYALTFGCVSGGDFGAMGLHYLNGDSLTANMDVDAARDHPVRADAKRSVSGSPARTTSSGRSLERDAPGEGRRSSSVSCSTCSTAPNRFGLEPFYTLHVWAWKDNPNGTFVNWNPDVSCDGFNPPQGSNQ